MNTKRILYQLAMVTLSIGFLSIGLVTYWLIAPYDVLELKKGNGELTYTEVKSGSYLEMRQVYCKKTNLVSTVDRKFIDGILYQAPQIKASRKVGCYDTIEYVYIPKALPTGTMKLQDTISFKVNPLRTVTYTVETDSFTIYK